MIWIIGIVAGTALVWAVQAGREVAALRRKLDAIRALRPAHDRCPECGSNLPDLRVGDCNADWHLPKLWIRG